jgi:hypothetical protein
MAQPSQHWSMVVMAGSATSLHDSLLKPALAISSGAQAVAAGLLHSPKSTEVGGGKHCIG